MEAKGFLEFGPFRVDTRSRVLLRGAEVVPLPPKALDVLLALLQRPGETFGKDELMKAVWPDTFVEEGNLTQMIFLLRKALEGPGDSQPLIVTMPRQGYRFVGELTNRPPAIRSRRRLWIAAAAAIAAAGGAAVWTFEKRSGLSISAIAVLPFADISQHKDLEYFCDGIADEIIDALSQIPDLRVTGRGSAFQFKNKNEDARTIGSKLDVQALLEGTIRRDGERLRITAELVSTKNAYRIWAESYDRKAGDIFAVQRAISRSIAEALRARVGGDVYTPRRYTADFATYDLYLKGRHASFADPMRGVEYFNQALQRSRDYAPAYAGLADAYFNMTTVNPNETLREAEEAAQTASSLDDRLPEAHFSKARVLRRNWAWREAMQEIDRAIQLAPSYGPALLRRGDLLLFTGREREARSAYRKAEAVDPMMPNLLERKLQMLFYMRRFDETIELSKQYPDVRNSSYYLGRAYAEKGMVQEGIALLETNWSRARGGQGFGVLAGLYARAGRRADAIKLLDEVREIARRAYVKPCSMAQLYIGLGDFDEAFSWLDRAFELHDPTLSSLKLEICWDPIRNDRRFKSLLKKVHLDD